MDKLERIRERRDEYESAMDDAERLRDEYHREIVKLHRSGMSLREIAEGLGISHQRVHQIVSPLEERSNERRGRKKAAGAASVAIAVLVTGGILLTRSREPVTHPSPAAAPAEQTGSPTQAVMSCSLGRPGHSSFSPITAAAKCAHRPVMLLDPETGRILAVVSDARLIPQLNQFKPST
jgi:hypothetical protein